MKKDLAVSPVIGVLLMLTLTLIIAAIVNSYAGGLMETEPKAPAVTLQTALHQNYPDNSLEIVHTSGDPLPVSSIKLIIRPSETFGFNAPQQLSQIDKSYITNVSDPSQTWSSGITAFKPGDLAIISAENLNHIQSNVDREFWVTNSSNLGKTFLLEVYYKNSMISRNEVLIE
ncbi:type IV pilin N-terminal domain-containing protein [Methanospirillum hungatei]|jgi:FlaG/FlaF family flagellin (archaellin)|uniref:type IV pilin N-terminal domain-containing protein n=1 Tax=Methanospirillum hungatei TaxID=2203 RepID=UPI0009D4944D|nr:type IV pilin N-terminal domain-containing protein [Methanospirillum hungatei]OQA59514.1 MAG: hypothetical protein BWY45_00699 [Euryarchaeota archaeon ADurb.Bin294]HOW05282.1 type IV pilin N-terminal domain-containing protein [Methanospirillum hungatei]